MDDGYSVNLDEGFVFAHPGTFATGENNSCYLVEHSATSDNIYYVNLSLPLI
jgi:hypothetical protein